MKQKVSTKWMPLCYEENWNADTLNEAIFRMILINSRHHSSLVTRILSSEKFVKFDYRRPKYLEEKNQWSRQPALQIFDVS